MNAFRLAPAGLATLVLGAHFLRQGNVLVVAVCLAVFALLFVRRPWVPAVVAGFLVLATLEWVRTLVTLVAEREAQGEPTGRMVAILGSVAGITAASMLAFLSRPVRERYAPSAPAAPPAEGGDAQR